MYRLVALVGACSAASLGRLSESMLMASALADDLADEATHVSFLQAPCVDGESCAAANLAANRCAFVRASAEAAYEALNVAVNGFGKVVAQQCGCVYSGGSSVCSLGWLPASCQMPNAIFGSMFGASVKAWSAVKETSSKCQTSLTTLV